MRDTRQHVHDLIDQLPPPQLAALAGLLEAMLGADATVHSSVEDERISEEEEQAVARSKEWFKHQKGHSLEEVAAEIGISMDDVRNPKDRG